MAHAKMRKKPKLRHAEARPPAYVGWKEGLLLGSLALLCFIGIISVQSMNVINEYRPALQNLIAKPPCTEIHHVPLGERCHFVQNVCKMSALGNVNYLEFYYCSPLRPLAFGSMVLWLIFLFAFVGIAASDFFCPNLSTIASSLHMSESIAGVTFLAFGNGSPDVFSTLSAMKAGSGTLAIGELFGAACFIVSVVTGSMILVKPFKVNSTVLTRDTLFFVGAITAVLAFLADGQLRLWETMLLIAYYIVYVSVVILSGVYAKRQSKKQSSINRARAQYIDEDGGQIGEAFDPEDMVDDPLIRRSSGDLTPAEEYAEITAAMSARHPGALQSGGQMILTPASDHGNEYFGQVGTTPTIGDVSAGPSTQAVRKRRTTILRPSLVGAVEFRDVVHALQSSSGARHFHLMGDHIRSPTMLSPEMLGGSRRQALRSTTTPHNRVLPTLGSLDRRHSLQEESVIVLPNDREQSASAHHHRRTKSRSTSDGQIIPNLEMTDQLSSEQWPTSGPLAQNNRDETVPNDVAAKSDADRTLILLNDENVDPWRGAVNVRPALHLSIPSAAKRKQGHLSPSQGGTPTIVLSPAHSPEASNETSLKPDTSSSGPFNDKMLQRELEPVWKKNIRRAIKVLFPTLDSFKQKSSLGMVLGIMSTPAIFLLIITLPVVDEEDLAQSREAMSSRSRQDRGPIHLPDDDIECEPRTSQLEPEDLWEQTYERATEERNETVAEALREPVEAKSAYGFSAKASWPRNLTATQLLLSPILIVSSLLEPDSSWFWVIGALFTGIIASLLTLLLTTPDRAPYNLQCSLMFLGFLVAMIWIMTIVNEVVGVLQAIGMIVGISDAILGLTIFAMGNSLGDLVSNITVARMGFPTMALSACFGGPLLNLLMGVGLGGTYKVLATRHPFEIDISTTLLVAGGGLVSILLLTLLAVFASKWVMTKQVGCGLLGLYLALLTTIIIVEVNTSSPERHR